jgi:hypothetical protein
MTIIISGVRAGRSMVGLDATQWARSEPTIAQILPPMQQVGGTCYAYAVARLCELHGFKNPSPAWINHHALTLDRMPENEWEGSYAKSAIAAVVYNGLCTTRECPMRTLKLRKPPHTQAIIAAAKNKRWSATMGGWPRVITSHVHDEATVYTHGKSAPLSRKGAIIGSHVWVYLGLDSTGQHVVQSSWGAWGGPNGIAYISESYLQDSWDQWGLLWT